MALSLMKNGQNSFKNFFLQTISRAVLVRFWKNRYHYDWGSEIFNLSTQTNYFEPYVKIFSWPNKLSSPELEYIWRREWKIPLKVWASIVENCSITNLDFFINKIQRGSPLKIESILKIKAYLIYLILVKIKIYIKWMVPSMPTF